MGTYTRAFGPHAPEATYVPHTFDEQLFDSGEVELNYVVAGAVDAPALLLVPGQTESWWGYEAALPLLAEHFRVHAVDLRGQGRSTRTPGRYTLDNIGNDLVRFIDGVIGRPTIVAGLSSGGVISAWLSAYARPGQVIGAYYEDPPLFASEIRPVVGQSIGQSIGPIFAHMSKYLGDQWSIGDWDAMVGAIQTELPPHLAFIAGLFGLADAPPQSLPPQSLPPQSLPPQSLKEYDPEWGRAFWSGSFYASCPHDSMLRAVKVPVLFTHHVRAVDESSGFLMGAISDLQVARVRQLVTDAGNAFAYRSFPQMGHSMHGQDPRLYTETLTSWARTLPPSSTP
jgi:pimeloyl-ACP methyl ester carboxylesterase